MNNGQILGFQNRDFYEKILKPLYNISKTRKHADLSGIPAYFLYKNFTEDVAVAVIYKQGD